MLIDIYVFCLCKGTLMHLTYMEFVTQLKQTGAWGKKLYKKIRDLGHLC